MAMEQPERHRIHRAGTCIQPAPTGIASKPFWVETLVEAADGTAGAMIATLEPGTVPHWHSHPTGQILYVLSGVGLMRRDGGLVTELRAGDCISFDPDERHWHGATPTTTFSYLSIQTARDGRTVIWFEPVSSGDSQ